MKGGRSLELLLGLDVVVPCKQQCSTITVSKEYIEKSPKPSLASFCIRPRATLNVQVVLSGYIRNIAA